LKTSAYLLVAHGSRDPRPQIAIEHLAKSVAQRLQVQELRSETVAQVGVSSRDPHFMQPPLGQFAALTGPPVGTAALELAPAPLHQQIQQFADKIFAQGYQHLQILPLFLLPGVHVMEDIPAEVAIARQALSSDLSLEIRPYLGSHPQLAQLLINPVEPIETSATAGKILLAHGSRRLHGNRPVEEIAAQLGAVPAYWSVAPSLDTQVNELIQKGFQQIAILPYFLFEGSITDAIEQTVQHLAQQFPYAQLHLGRAIGPTPQLAEQVIQLLSSDR
jgi:sirohydrochlorin cobaltochelatase